MIQDKGNSEENCQPNDTKSDKDVTINQLKQFIQEYKLDDEDIQLLSEFQVQKPICLLKGKYRLSKRQLYRRAKKLTEKGLLNYLKDGKLKHYFVTKEGRRVIDICFRGSEETPENVRNSSSFLDPTEKIIRTHNYYVAMKIHTRPKSLDTLLKRGSRTTGIKPQNMTNWIKYHGWMHFDSCAAHVEITTQNVFVRIKEIITTDPKDAAGEAARVFDMVKAELEETLSTPVQAFRLGDFHLRTSGVVKAKHHAILLHPLAQKCKKHGYSVQGDTWTIDASKGIPEAEATDPIHATEDCDYALQDLERSSRARIGVMDNREEINAIKNELKEILGILKTHSEVQQGILAQVLANSQANAQLNQLISQQNQRILSIFSAFEKLTGGKN
ncbi:MAG: hypothetical protein ACFFDT_30275 [Candidatus Hodarchaeota archaeon]